MKINPFIWGLALGFFISGLPVLITHPEVPPLRVIGVLLGLGAAGLAIAHRERWIAMGLAVGLGVLLVNFVQIVIDMSFDLYDHTLFPIEMAMVFGFGLLFAMPGAFLGFLASRFLGAGERLGQVLAGLSVLFSIILTIYLVF